MRIREACLDDVNGIAHVHINSWRTTYKGIISDDYLASLNVEQRQKNWIWTFNNPNPDEVTFIVEDSEGKILGFINGGKSRTPEYKYDAELYAIYFLMEYQRLGLGIQLVKSLVTYLRSNQYKSLMVWVLEKNPSVDFYKRLGGNVIADKEIQIGEEAHTELALGWVNLDDIEVSRSVL